MAINNIMLVPGDSALNPITIPGTKRTYSGAVGSLTSVPDFDAIILRNTGWVAVNAGNMGGGSGPTASRPAYPAINPGFQYNDTTLSAQVVYVGPKSGWVRADSGASA